jgi:hypothetical protein
MSETDPARFEGRTIFQAAAVAAGVATLCALFMGFGVRAPEPGLSLQPSMATGSVTDFLRPINQYPALALRFFAADSLFVLSYLVVFFGWHALAAPRAPALAGLGLAAGIAAAVFDALENAHFIVYASLALRGVPPPEPALPLIYLIANLKWETAFAALLAFGLIWPREGWVDRGIAGLMLLFPLVGVLGVAMPDLVPIRSLFFLIAMPLFAWYFWRAARSAA